MRTNAQRGELRTGKGRRVHSAIVERRYESTQGDPVKRMVRRSKSQLDRLQNQSIVKSVDEKTPPEGVGSTNRGLTDHADTSSMAAESYSNLTLSSRQLLPSATDDFSVSRQVEYVPPADKVVRGYAMAVCNELAQRDPDAFSGLEIRQGFLQFVNVLIHIQIKQANKRSAK